MRSPLLRTVIAALVIVTPACPPAPTCTAFQLEAHDGAFVSCRSKEFGFPFHSQLLVIPRGTDHTGTAPERKPGLRWRTTCGVVGLNVNIAHNIVADGMSEKGLVVGMLHLPGYSQYLAPDDAKTAKTLGSWEVCAFLLSARACFEALRDTAHVAGQEFPPFKQVLPVLERTGDASGKVVVAEYVGGILRIHEITNVKTYVRTYGGRETLAAEMTA